MSIPRQPLTRAEWQAAVDAAEFSLLLESARQYGLVAGGLSANVARCEDLLLRGKALGIVPTKRGGP